MNRLSSANSSRICPTGVIPTTHALAETAALYDSIQQQAPVALVSDAAAGGLRLLVSFEQPLLHEAILALARHDDRFLPVQPAVSSPADGEPERCVALLDGGCKASRIRPLVKRFRPVGGVLLTDTPYESGDEGSELGPMRFAGIELAVLGYHASWSRVAKALLHAARGRFEPAQPSDYATAVASEICVADDLQRFASLTRREKEVLIGIGRGHSPQQIAKQLRIAISTVENHKSRLMKKIDIHKSVELVRFAIRVGAAPV